MFATGPSQLCVDVDPEDWTDGYLAELAKGGTSTLYVNGLELNVVVARVDEDIRRVWFRLADVESAVQAEALSATIWADE